MSRVFEALTKAAEAKQRRVEWPVEKVEDAVKSETPDEEANPNPEQFIRANGTFSRTNGTVHETYTLCPVATNGDKSLWERIEELLLGWDLWRYKSYPIVALEKDSPASEQYKILREQVKQSGIQSFSITSPVKRDGKTTVAVNLAAALSLDYDEGFYLSTVISGLPVSISTSTRPNHLGSLIIQARARK
jgi:Mrp family chromosome partitioning ATPase